jgi:hypothetical protein
MNWSSAETGGIGLRDVVSRQVQLTPLATATLCCAAAMLLMFVRWLVLVRAQGLPFTLRDAVRLGMVGMFVNTFFAGEMGSDVAKAVGLAREQTRRAAAVATVLMDRIVGMLGLFWLAGVLGSVFWLLGTPALREHASLLWIIRVASTFAGASLLLWLLLVLLPDSLGPRPAQHLGGLSPVSGLAAELWIVAWTYRSRSGTVVLALALAVGSHVCYTLTFFFAVQMFQEVDRPIAMPTLTEHFLLIPVGELIQALFPSPGGAGGAEYGYGKLYSMVGQPESNGVLAALAYRVILWGLSLMGYFAALRMRPTPSEPEA